MADRCLRLARRNVDAMMTALMLPIMLMLMFVYPVGGAIHTGTSYVMYVVPGVLVLCAGFGSATTAVTVSQDMTTATVDRLRAMDVGGPAFLAGHVVASIVRNIASTIVVFAVAFAVGFRTNAGALGWVAAAGVILAFIIAISWLAAAIGLLAKTPEAAGGFTFVIMFLPYASSAFVPVHTMPSWIQGFALHQPVTPVIEATRALLLDQSVGSNAWAALAWCIGILVASVAIAGGLFQRRTH